MKKYILKSLFVSMLCMLAASCQDTNEFEQTLDSSKAQVMFSVAMDSPMSRSRALTWGDDYTPEHIGDLYDNRIDANQLVVKIEAEGKKYKVNDIVKKQVGEVNEYTFVGVVEGIKQTTTLSNAKVSVFANMGRNAENLTFAQNAEYIPMWGMRTENLKLTPGERAQLSAISLLRAMAKIEVSLNADMAKQFALTGATLNRHNPTGNSLPTIKTAAKHTTDLELEGVFNPLSGTQQPLAFEKVENGNSYVVYLPEVSRGKSDADHLNIEVQLNAKDEAGNLIKGAIEIGNFNVFDYSKNVDSPEVIDIVRNHWYKYNISGFAAGEIEVNYQAMDWNGVDINVGGEGFLFLNKDVIEIYNSNIDADQLKFSSSSPINIVLKDIYKHENNGTFTEGTKEIVDGETVYDGDDLSAYYITKFGQKIQLGAYPGFDVEEGALDKENNILNAISAVPVYDETGLNGGITINSPYIGHATYGNSHYNTIRYLEFEVTNEQGLTATFRVMQYPPLVVTNEEGYFSYRSDQKYSDDQKEASHFHNYMGWKSLHLSGLMWNYVYDWTNEPDKSDTNYWGTDELHRNYSWVPSHGTGLAHNCEVLHYGNIGAPHTFKDSRGVEVTYTYGGLYRPAVHPTDAFVRERYYSLADAACTGIYSKGGYRFNSKNYDHPKGDVQGNAVGAVYEENGKKYRKHFTWNVQPVFYNLYVDKVYKENGADRLKGQADIHSMTHATTTYYGDKGTGWTSWGRQSYTNHRMYVIRATGSSLDYNIGYPTLTEEGVTENTEANANIVSPNFAVASQLGETRYQSVVNEAAKYPAQYKVPEPGKFYQLAVEHCREYVETTYEDVDGSGTWSKLPDGTDEPVTHYDNWRLPTKAEIDLIIKLQDQSRAMDKLLVGEYYFCAVGLGDDADINNKDNWVSRQVPNFTPSKTGYYIRCVRDVKPGDKNDSNNKIK